MPVVLAAPALHPRPVWAGRGRYDLVSGNHLSAAATRVEGHARLLRLVRLTGATPIRSTVALVDTTERVAAPWRARRVLHLSPMPTPGKQAYRHAIAARATLAY